MLAVKVHQFIPDGGKHRHGNHLSVRCGAAPPVGGHRARQNQPVLLQGDIMLLQQCGQRWRRFLKPEHGLHGCFRGTRPYGVGGSAAAQGQAKRADHNGFPRTGFPGQHIKTRL
ncbi:MAG: hypothetical protein BWY09_02911 [Candidatus Hydrogenedentes bacterium ADurb.Bin179]|nr:MAG: hypothetical protein BWY09_02911 [Candidatus Hydrogenedentes bacterium ADurb.Bin179]